MEEGREPNGMPQIKSYVTAVCIARIYILWDGHKARMEGGREHLRTSYVTAMCIARTTSYVMACVGQDGRKPNDKWKYIERAEGQANLQGLQPQWLVGTEYRESQVQEG